MSTVQVPVPQLGVPPVPDYPASWQFLQMMHPGRLVVVTKIMLGGPTATRTFGPGQWDAFASWMEAASDPFNAYFSVAEPLRVANKKLARDEVARVHHLHVDVDIGQVPNRDVEGLRILGVLRDPPRLPPPTVIVFSGGGYQAFWTLATPIEIGGDLDRAEDAKLYNIAIERALGGDHCHDICRIMRLPGTVNLPNEKKRQAGRVPTLATVVEYHTDRVYDLSRFAKAAPDRGTAIGSRQSGPVAVVPPGAPAPASLDDLPFGVSDLCRAVIRHGRDPDDPSRFAKAGGEIDRSKAVFFVVAELLRARVPDDRIVAVLCDPGLAISASVRESKDPARFARRQVERVRRKISDEIPAAPAGTEPAAAPGGDKPAGKRKRTPTREELLAERDRAADEALASMPPEVVKEAEGLLVEPQLTDVILGDLGALGVVGEEQLALTTYVIATSRLLDKPLSGIVQGPTSTGKSYVPFTAMQLFPREAVLVATDITTNALYYAPPGSLMHVFVLAGERPRIESEENADARKALREIVASGELSKLVTVKGKDGHSARLVYQPGPIAFMESTTAANIFDEDANRVLRLGTDESEQQTARIIRAQAEAARVIRTGRGGLALRHHALQRLLRRVDVQIPYAGVIAVAIPTQRHEARRAMPMILATIKAVALLHQRQRPGFSGQHGAIINANLDDYAIARDLLDGPMGRALGGALPDAVARFGERLTEQHGADSFTSTEALGGDTVLSSKGKVNEYLRCLEGAGVVECVEEARGAKPTVWRVVGKVPSGGALWLPSIEQVKEAH